MINQDGYTAGWIDSSIGDLLNSRADLMRQFRYVLVTSIDSASELSILRETRPILERHPGAQLLGHGLLLPGEAVAEVNSTFGLFTGFDEVWCFADPPSAAKPDDVSLVAPLDLTTDTVPDSVIHWMRRSRCRLGLGDGFGMNYITPEESVAELLRRCSAT